MGSLREIGQAGKPTSSIGGRLFEAQKRCTFAARFRGKAAREAQGGDCGAIPWRHADASNSGTASLRSYWVSKGQRPLAAGAFPLTQWGSGLTPCTPLRRTAAHRQPVPLLVDLLQVTPEGGTTALACQQSGRRWSGVARRVFRVDSGADSSS